MVFQLLSRLRPSQRAFSAFVMAAAVWAAPGLAGAMSRMGEAEVLDKDGQPCFYLPEKEMARGPSVRVHAIAVSDESARPVKDMWGASVDPASTPVSAAACIVYGRAGAERKPAQALKAGPVYEVYLNGRSADPGDSTQGYTAKFCFIADGANGRKLVMVKPDMPAWRSGTCQ